MHENANRSTAMHVAVMPNSNASAEVNCEPGQRNNTNAHIVYFPEQYQAGTTKLTLQYPLFICIYSFVPSHVL